MTDLRKAAEMALEVLVHTKAHTERSQNRVNDAKRALREALAKTDYRDKDIADLTKACQVLLRENLRLQEELNK